MAPDPARMPGPPPSLQPADAAAAVTWPGARAWWERSRGEQDRLFGRYALLCALITLALFAVGLVASPARERPGILLIDGLAGSAVVLAIGFLRRGLSAAMLVLAGVILMALGVLAGAALTDGLDGAAVLPLAGALLVLPVLRGRRLVAAFGLAFAASMVGETAAYTVGGMTRLTGLVSVPVSLAESAVMLAFTYGLVWWVSNEWRLASARSEAVLGSQGQILARQRQVLALNERLLATLDPQQVLNLIADSLKAVVPYDNLTIYRVDRAAGVFRPVLARDRFADVIMEATFPLERGITGWVLQHGEAQCVNDAHRDPRMNLIAGTPAEEESLIIVPLTLDGRVGGTLNVGRMGGVPAHFDASEFEIARLFASQASLALQNAEAHHAVSARAETDALTGLRNRGAFEADFTAFLSEPGGQPLSLLMLDLDDFKAFNDRHGHPAGDALLQSVAGALRDTIRARDRAYRYGGDEFAVLLPSTPCDAALQVAARITAVIAALGAGGAGHITASVGAASYPEDAATQDALLAAADAALYRGKDGGGDRVVLAEAPTETAVVPAANEPSPGMGLR
jgi:diguanylate cyclase (GGDEF)-like protein